MLTAGEHGAHSAPRTATRAVPCTSALHARPNYPAYYRDQEPAALRRTRCAAGVNRGLCSTATVLVGGDQPQAALTCQEFGVQLLEAGQE